MDAGELGRRLEECERKCRQLAERCRRLEERADTADGIRKRYLPMIEQMREDAKVAAEVRKALHDRGSQRWSTGTKVAAILATAVMVAQLCLSVALAAGGAH